MPEPSEAYLEGYRKGRRAGLADGVAESLNGMLRDDPGGYFAAGYRDGVNHSEFKPPQPTAVKAAIEPSVRSPLTALEKQWYNLCTASEFIPQYTVDYYSAALKAQRSHVAFVIGLLKFTGHACPKCGDKGQFKVRFLGRLNHADCQWSGYMGTGAYIGFQVSQIVHSGIRVGGAVKDEADKKERAGGNWVYGLLTFLFVAIFRTMVALIVIPLHAVVALFQAGQTRAEIVMRVVTLLVIVAALIFGILEIRDLPTQAHTIP